MRHPREESSPAQILVVDDHDLNRKLFERLLERHGYVVHSVSSLMAADRALAEQLPALVVLDLNLSDGDGLKLVGRLRGDPRTARAPIVACTAGVRESDRVRALTAGCDAFVEKPVDTREFAGLVADLLASAPSPLGLVPGSHG
jgi:two-component system, cell cycle response regulator DivK